MKNFIIVLCLLHSAFAAPQFITFKDGQIGVNFAGYHAEAGLGGGQNGNGLLGGLHASAGTPHGQNAAAGLGGSVNGRTAGVLYAGAQATPDIGASTILGGDVSRGGFSGAESHVPGKSNSHTRTTVFKEVEPADDYNETVTTTTFVQKVKPPKKFRKNDNRHNHSLNAGVSGNSESVSKTVSASNLPTTISKTKTISKTIESTSSNIGTASTSSSSSSAPSPASEAAVSISSILHPAIHNYNPVTSDRLNHKHRIDVVALPSPPSKPDNQATIFVTPPAIQLTHHHYHHSNENSNESSESIESNENQNDKTTVTTISKTKYRLRAPHPHRIRNQQRKLQKRINASNSGQQHQRLKTIVRTVNQHQYQQQQQQQHQQQQENRKQPDPQNVYQRHDQKLLTVIGNVPALPTHPQNPPQQEIATTYERRHQLIAPTETVYESDDTYYPPVRRSSHVVNALQIPVGILQSLQESLGR